METKLTTADQATLDAYRQAFQSATPFPHLVIDEFLPGDWADRVAGSFPGFQKAAGVGRVFESVNEHQKLQIMQSEHFAPETSELHEVLASAEFRARLSEVTDILSLIHI